MTEKELLALMSRDPRRGFEQAIRQYTPYVMKIVRTKLEGACSYEDIEVTVSDVFVMFHKYITKNSSEIGRGTSTKAAVMISPHMTTAAKEIL